MTNDTHDRPAERPAADRHSQLEVVAEHTHRTLDVFVAALRSGGALQIAAARRAHEASLKQLRRTGFRLFP